MKNDHFFHTRMALTIFTIVTIGLSFVSCNDKAENIVQEMKAAKEVKESNEAEAAEQVRNIAAQRLNMSDSEKQALSIYIHGRKNDWAWVEVEGGLKMLCRRKDGKWDILSMGTDPKFPEDAPMGLIDKARSKKEK